MKEQLISLETAKLAKEKGFDWKTEQSWSYIIGVDGKHFLNYNIYKGYSAPTQAFLQKWLRERPTPIIVTPITDFVAWEVEILNPDTGTISIDKVNDRWIDSYEAALETGLLAALNTI